MNPVDKSALCNFHTIFTSDLDRRVGKQHNFQEKTVEYQSHKNWKTAEFSVKIMGM